MSDRVGAGGVQAQPYQYKVDQQTLKERAAEREAARFRQTNNANMLPRKLGVDARKLHLMKGAYFRGAQEPQSQEAQAQQEFINMSSTIQPQDLSSLLSPIPHAKDHSIDLSSPHLPLMSPMVQSHLSPMPSSSPQAPMQAQAQAQAQAFTPTVSSLPTPPALNIFDVPITTKPSPSSFSMAAFNSAPPRGHDLALDDRFPSQPIINRRALPSSSSSSSSPLATAGIHSQRRFRVGWGPNGTFTFTVNQRAVAISRVAIYAHNTQMDRQTHQEEVISALKVHEHHNRLHNTMPIDHPDDGDNTNTSTYNNDNNNDMQTDQPMSFAVVSVDGNTAKADALKEKQAKLLDQLCTAHTRALGDIVDARNHNLSSIPHNAPHNMGVRALSTKPLIESMSVWNLVKALWAPANGASPLAVSESNDSGRYCEAYARREALGTWLQYCVHAEVDQEIKARNVQMYSSGSSLGLGSELTSSIAAENVFSLISGNRIDEACTEAFKLRDFRLAMLLSQAGEDLESQLILRQQITEWKNAGVWDMIDEGHKTIYLLLSGDTSIKPDLDSWLRAFGIPLWYGRSSQNSSIAHALTLYDQSVELKHATPPSPPYLASSSPSSSSSPLSSPSSVSPSSRSLPVRGGGLYKLWDVRYSLVRLHCDSRLPLSRVLVPEAAVPSALDYSLSWHLHDMLQYTSCPTFPHALDLFMNFVCQLDTMGLWKWAIYVLQITGSENYKNVFATSMTSEKRKALIKDILCRNVEPAPEDTVRTMIKTKRVKHTNNISKNLFDLSIPDTMHAGSVSMSVQRRQKQEQTETDNFLTQVVGIPRQWIEEARAFRARSLHLYETELYHLLQANQFNDAHEVFVTRLLSVWVLKEEYEAMRSLLIILDCMAEKGRMDSDTWSMGGSLIKQYLDLLLSFRDTIRQVPNQLTDAHVHQINTVQQSMKELLENLSSLEGIGRGQASIFHSKLPSFTKSSDDDDNAGAGLGARAVDERNSDMLLSQVALSEMVAKLSQYISVLDARKLSSSCSSSTVAARGGTAVAPFSLLDEKTGALLLTPLMTEDHRLQMLGSMCTDYLTML